MQLNTNQPRLNPDAWKGGIMKTGLWFKFAWVLLPAVVLANCGPGSGEFKVKIEEHSTTRVVLWDERLTSKMANNMMINQNLKRKKRKQDIDKMAAGII